MPRERDVRRAADHAQERCERQTLAAALHLAGQAIGVGFQVRGGVRRHAELGNEQCQRQHMHDQAAMRSEQDPKPPGRERSTAARVVPPLPPPEASGKGFLRRRITRFS